MRAHHADGTFWADTDNGHKHVSQVRLFNLNIEALHVSVYSYPEVAVIAGSSSLLIYPHADVPEIRTARGRILPSHLVKKW